MDGRLSSQPSALALPSSADRRERARTRRGLSDEALPQHAGCPSHASPCHDDMTFTSGLLGHVYPTRGSYLAEGGRELAFELSQIAESAHCVALLLSNQEGCSWPQDDPEAHTVAAVACTRSVAQLPPLAA